MLQDPGPPGGLRRPGRSAAAGVTPRLTLSGSPSALPRMFSCSYSGSAIQMLPLEDRMLKIKRDVPEGFPKSAAEIASPGPCT
jgi:hypothetical protein